MADLGDILTTLGDILSDGKSDKKGNVLPFGDLIKILPKDVRNISEAVDLLKLLGFDATMYQGAVTKTISNIFPVAFCQGLFYLCNEKVTEIAVSMPL